MKMEDIRAKSQDELKDMIMSLKREQFNLRFQQVGGEMTNTSRFRDVRRDVARAKTVMTQKINGEPVAAPKKEKTTKAKAKKTNAA
jgi:large subunit ribosomal protein L29